MVGPLLKGAHPSDKLGAVLAVVDHLARKRESVTVKAVLECVIKEHSHDSTRSILSASATLFS